jgi:hypothetical protein
VLFHLLGKLFADRCRWAAMTTADFASFKAIVLADPSYSYDPTVVDFLGNTKNTWGPAVTGNTMLIGKYMLPL